MDKLLIKVWVVAIADSNVPVLGPCVHRDHFWALRKKPKFPCHRIVDSKPNALKKG